MAFGKGESAWATRWGVAAGDRALAAEGAERSVARTAAKGRRDRIAMGGGESRTADFETPWC